MSLEYILLLRGSLSTVIAEAMVSVERDHPLSNPPWAHPDGPSPFFRQPPLPHHLCTPPQNSPVIGVEQEECCQRASDESPCVAMQPQNSESTRRDLQLVHLVGDHVLLKLSVARAYPEASCTEWSLGVSVSLS